MPKPPVTDAAPTGALPPELAALPGHLFWRAAARTTNTMAETLPRGIDVHGYAALVTLADGSSRSQQHLADRLDVSRTTMTKLLATLENSGLVARTRDPDDRRQYLVGRTPAGAEAAAAWKAHADLAEESLAAHLTPAERRLLADGLRTLLAGELATDTPEALLASLGFLVTRMHARLHQQFGRALEPVGIEPRHFASLVTLQRQGPITQAELARSLGLSPPSVVEVVDDLEHGGLLERRRDPADRRRHLLRLLPRATEILPLARRRQRQLDERFDVLGDRRGPFLAALLRFVEAG